MITAQDIEDIAVTAFEGGIGYWTEEIEIMGDKGEGSTIQHITDGGTVLLTSIEGLGYFIGPNTIRKGIRKAAAFREMGVTEFIEQHDIEDADIAVQLGIFDEIVYG